MTQTEKFHFIGIGGIGMSGLARILLNKKMAVSGSDITSSYVTEGLLEAGAQVTIGHTPQNIPAGATVIYSTDIKQNNSEYQAAKEQNAVMMHRSDLLLDLMKNFKTLSVTGTHGKTTTSSLLAWVLKEGGLDPSYAVGGVIPQLHSNAGHGEGEYFVAEADESDGTFLKYSSYGAIITNVDADHMDHFKTMDNLIGAFQTFVDHVASEHLFWCGDNEYLQQMHPHGVSYGFGHQCQLRVSNAYQKGWMNLFDVNLQGTEFHDIQIPLIGKHNILNAAAVFGLALSLGVSEESIRKAFLSFGGVKRRCEKKGEIQNILLLDDYAHHPVEIKTTIEGIRDASESRRVIAVFQPHRYSRTKECLGTYKGIFKAADEVYVTDIYSAGEDPIPGISSEIIIEELESDGITKCHYVSRQQLAEKLSDVVRTHDIVVSLGAGDITKFSNELLEVFKKKSPPKLQVGILFGGRSTEHEVTFLSANHIMNCVNPEIYDIQHFALTKQGNWICGVESLQKLKEYKDHGEPKQDQLMTAEVLNQLLDCEVLVPVFHGPMGEDGTMQGFCEIMDKAYVGPDYTSAAIAMDKALTKHLMHVHLIPTLPFVEMQHQDWVHNPSKLTEKINALLSYPVFIKPVHLGSTVGVKKVDEPLQLHDAIEEAFNYDYKLIVEQGLQPLREIEFAVLGNENAIVFPPGEILASGEVYDFDAKYGPQGMNASPSANLPQHLIEEGKALALKAYKAIGCTGMSRVDFFLDANEKFWLNEINPIPGFTPISLYPKICEVNGINGQELLDRLIIYALERKRRNAVLCRNR